MEKTLIAKILIALISFVILFHFLIVIKIIPYQFAWGGRLKNDAEMYVFELASIGINVFLIFLLLMKSGRIKRYLSQRVLNFILWLFLILFVINTFANLFAQTNVEKIFSFFTCIFSILLWMLLKENKRKYSGS